MSIASILTVFDIHGVKGSEINPLCLFDEEALVRYVVLYYLQGTRLNKTAAAIHCRLNAPLSHAHQRQ